MATTLEQINLLETEVKKLKDLVIYYRKLFMADGHIDSDEQKELDAMGNKIKNIETCIADKLSKLSYYEKGLHTVSSLKEDVVEFVTDSIHTVKDFVTGEDHEEHIEKPAPIGQKINAPVGKGKEKNATDTRVIQTLLNNHGAKINVDGDCGPKTIAAIEAFQKKAGLPVTGVVVPDGVTLTYLNKKTIPAADTPTDNTPIENPLPENPPIDGSSGNGGGTVPKWITIARNEISVGAASNFDRLMVFFDDLCSVGFLEYRFGKEIAAQIKANKELNGDCDWCGIFVSYCLKQAGYATLGFEGANSQVWKKYGTLLDKPCMGCIAIKSGHVGFVTGCDASGKITLLGGNQGSNPPFKTVVSEISFGKKSDYTFVVPANYTVPTEAYF